MTAEKRSTLIPRTHIQAHSWVYIYTCDRFPLPPCSLKCPQATFSRHLLSLSTPAIHTYTGTCLAAPLPPPHLLGGQGPGPEAGHTEQVDAVLLEVGQKGVGPLRQAGSEEAYVPPPQRHKVARPGKGQSFCQPADRASSGPSPRPQLPDRTQDHSFPGKIGNSRGGRGTFWGSGGNAGTKRCGVYCLLLWP